ncbi:MAG TPA: DUF2891 domain-containing protein [Streptosporangiaceae bacterium]|nr:DUF2891 domain-containing protein [Streptosporangiaceae bacterium]
MGDTTGLVQQWRKLLFAEATNYAQVAVTNIKREFPADVHHTMTRPGDFPFRPRARTPVFYGSLDWHSCVEMHWVLVRLLRIAPDHVPASEVRAALRTHFSTVGMTAEAEYISGPGKWGQRPYGWGWALMLAEETRGLADSDGHRWSAAMEPLARAVTQCFLEWLPKATYPVRHGVHGNSAFGLSRALPFARRIAAEGDPVLLAAITDKAFTWFGGDTIYPGAWEPSGHDFLSPALCEAELMAQVLPGDEFGFWLSMFLPGIAGGEPETLFTPAVVSDATDGQIAHLHGLNASRAWCWRRIAESLPPDDPRVGPAMAAAQTHAEAALPHVVGDDYMVEHWLACYAVLMLS